MFVTKIKSVLAVVLIVAALAGAAGLIHQTQAAEQPTAKEEQPAAKKEQNKGEEKNATTWQERATWEGHVDKVNRLVFSPDGKTLASASDDSTVIVRNLATGKELVSLKEPDGGGVRGLAFAPDGKTFATAGGDKGVRLWDAAKGTQLQEFKGHTAATYSVVFSPDGKTLVSGGGCANYPEKGQTGYGEIRLWDPATGKERTSVQTHSWPVAHLAFTADGKTLISGGYDNTIKFWDWDGKAQPQEWRTITVGEGQGIYDMALSPDGKTLVVASEGTVKLWDLATGKESNTALEKSEYRNGYLWLSVAFAPDGKTVAASSPIQEWEDKDKEFVVQRRSDVLLWDATTGKLRQKLRVDEPVTSLTFSQDGKVLVTGCKGKMREPARITGEEDIETEKRGVVKLWDLKKAVADKEQPKANEEQPAAKKDQKPSEEKQPMMKEEKLRVLIDKVLAAHGGEDKLNKLTSFTMTVKHSNGETQQYFVQPPKNFRWETTHQDRTGKRIVILFPEGRRWWTKEPNEEAKEFIPTGAEPTMEYWLDYVKFFGPRQVLRLKDADHKVALLDEEAKIDKRVAVGVEVTGPQFKGKMYFDKETHLLVKQRAVTYSDYKKFDGIPIAQKEHDGYFEPEVTDFRAVDKLDAKLFEQP